MAKSTIPDSFILIIGHIMVCLHLPYRQTEGLIKSTLGKNIPEDKQPPSYSQTCRRTNKLDIYINSSVDDYDVVIMAADSTGIKVTNRG
ncbi:MAG TPA: transposase [Verrucomicrobiae bacterium]|nr:transposase [Verrucomicrobiae bacterium]